MKLFLGASPSSFPNTIKKPTSPAVFKPIKFHNLPERSTGLLPSTRLGPRFGKGYLPQNTDRTPLQKAIVSNRAAFLPTIQMSAELMGFLNPTAHQPPSQVLIENLARMKRHSQTILTAAGVIPVQKEQFHTLNPSMIGEAKKFLTDLKTQHTRSEQVYKDVYSLNDKALQLYRQFVAQTSPAIFAMGFSDGVNHNAQVSRLCLMQAARLPRYFPEKQLKPLSQSELLQAAMVGWIHDPKFPSSVSKDNLATHPIVASSLVELLFHRAAPYYREHDLTQSNVLPLTTLLQGVLAEEGHDTPADWRKFVTGMMQALSVNNDSFYVVENIIIPKVKAQLPDRMRQPFEETALQRFWALSRNESPKPFSPAILRALHGIQLGTGLYKPLGKTGLFDEATVRASLMFTHPEILEEGWAAAIALTISDPLMLTLHKILIDMPNRSLAESMESYLVSLENNIKSLPAGPVYEDGRRFQKAVLASLINASHALTDNPERLTLEQSLGSSVQDLTNRIKASSLWKGSEDAPVSISKIAQALEESYGKMAAEYRRFAMAEDRGFTRSA